MEKKRVLIVSESKIYAYVNLVITLSFFTAYITNTLDYFSLYFYYLTSLAFAMIFAYQLYRNVNILRGSIVVSSSLSSYIFFSLLYTSVETFKVSPVVENISYIAMWFLAISLLFIISFFYALGLILPAIYFLTINIRKTRYETLKWAFLLALTTIQNAFMVYSISIEPILAIMMITMTSLAFAFAYLKQYDNLIIVEYIAMSFYPIMLLLYVRSIIGYDYFLMHEISLFFLTILIIYIASLTRDYYERSEIGVVFLPPIT